MPTSPHIFDGPDADLIIRAPLKPGSDEFKDFHSHKLILSFASVVFRDTFSIPQPPRCTPDDPDLDVIQISESAEVVEAFLQLIYPVDPPAITDLRLLNGLFQLADKYAAKGVTTRLKKFLISPSFLKDDPIGVYAIACRGNLDEEARLALPHTFAIDVIRQISEQNIQIMTTRAYHRLLTEHARRREQIIDAVNAARLSVDPGLRCKCMSQVEAQVNDRISGRPFLDHETFKSCVSAIRWTSSDCWGTDHCVSKRSPDFISDTMNRIQAL